MDINININFGDKTAEAVNNLADAIKNLTGLNFTTGNLVKAAEEKVEKAVTGKSGKSTKNKAAQDITKEPDKEPEKTADTADTAEIKTEEIKSTEDTPELSGLNLGSEISFGAEELRKATADLSGTSTEKRTAIITLLREKYNVNGFNNIDSSRYGEYAADIRALGANI